MISRRNAILTAITGLAGMGAAHSAFAKKPSPVASFDTDHDGTVDLAEAKKAASDLFDKLDAARDGTLDINELQGRLRRKDFATADPDNAKTLTKDDSLPALETPLHPPPPHNH